MKEDQLFIILDSVPITVFEDIVCAKSGWQLLLSNLVGDASMLRGELTHVHAM